MDLIARAWERPIDSRNAKRSSYGAGWTSIVNMLRGELIRISARSAIVEMDVSEADIRNDGWLRSNARPRTPGVRLSFTGKYGPLVYECATWRSWEHNVYAIARTLRAQRMIARDGAVKGDQVYRGFKALPGGGERPPIIAAAFPTVEDAARFLLLTANLLANDAAAVIANPETLQTVYRAAARRTHPDTGGSVGDFGKVNAAKEMIETEQKGGVLS